jgi:hypothetical protein
MRRQTTAGAKRRLLSFQPQVVAPQLFALNATYRAIGNEFLGRTIFDHMDRKPDARVAENAKFFDRLASGPKLHLPQAVSRQICTANSNGVFQKAHKAVPSGTILARMGQICPQENSDWAITFSDIRSAMLRQGIRLAKMVEARPALSDTMRAFKGERLPLQARLLAAPDAPRHRKHRRPRSRRGRRSVRRQRRGHAG